MDIIITIIIAVLTFSCCYDLYAEYKGHQDYLQDRKDYYQLHSRRKGKK